MAVAAETNANRTWMWRQYCSIDLVLKENKMSIYALVLKEKKFLFLFLVSNYCPFQSSHCLKIHIEFTICN
jgi:hypothetical protein